MDLLEQKFEDELNEKMLRAAKERRYNSSRFIQMIREYGGVGTSKRLIAKSRQTGIIPDGFTTFLMEGRLDLTMEDSVCKPEYASLFTEEEIAYCRELLGRY